jgi:hypothetical protein
MNADKWIFLIMIIVSWFFGIYGLYKFMENLPFEIFLFFIGNISLVLLALYGLIKIVQNIEKNRKRW